MICIYVMCLNNKEAGKRSRGSVQCTRSKLREGRSDQSKNKPEGITDLKTERSRNAQMW